MFVCKVTMGKYMKKVTKSEYFFSCEFNTSEWNIRCLCVCVCMLSDTTSVCVCVYMLSQTASVYAHRD